MFVPSTSRKKASNQELAGIMSGSLTGKNGNCKDNPAMSIEKVENTLL